jgi:Ankyrin repeats (3 copies)
MGVSFTNYQVRTRSVSQCAKAVAQVVSSRALVSEHQRGWITIYDEASDAQDIKEIRRVAKSRSAKTSTAVLALLVHDSDVLLCLFYDHGRLTDQFDSHPGYFGPVSDAQRKKWAGHFARLAKLAPRKTTAAALRDALTSPQPFAEERVTQFAHLLGIEPARALLGFRQAQESGNDYQLIHARERASDHAALIDAVTRDDSASVLTLLCQGVPPDLQDEHGYALRVTAARLGNPEIVRALIQAGADVLAEGKMPGDALWIAATEGHREILAELLKKAEGRTGLKKSLQIAIRWAVSSGHLEIVQDLIQASADVNAKYGKGATLLMYAAIRGHEAIWETFTGRTFPARPGKAKTDWPAMVRILLDAGADVQARANDGQTALSMATSKAEKNLAELLRNAGATDS